MSGSDQPQVDVGLNERPQGVVATVTIDNARALNAMSGALMDQLVGAMTQLAGNEHLRAVVLAGAGPKSFIVGADINEMASIANAEQARASLPACIAAATLSATSPYR